MPFSEAYERALAEGRRQTGDGKLVVSSADSDTEKIERVYPCELEDWYKAHRRALVGWQIGDRLNAEKATRHYHADGNP